MHVVQEESAPFKASLQDPAPTYLLCAAIDLPPSSDEVLGSNL